jgi:hypothetical protein
VLYFADGHRLGIGASGIDLGDLPWTENWPAEKEFFLRMIDTPAAGPDLPNWRTAPEMSCSPAAGPMTSTKGTRVPPVRSLDAADQLARGA